jgi:hypothetical protein
VKERKRERERNGSRETTGDIEEKGRDNKRDYDVSTRAK